MYHTGKRDWHWFAGLPQQIRSAWVGKSLHFRQLHQSGVSALGWGWNPPCGAGLSIMWRSRHGKSSRALIRSCFLSSSLILQFVPKTTTTKQVKVEHTKLFIEIIYIYGVIKKEDNFKIPTGKFSLGGQQLHYPLSHSALHLVLFFLMH